MRALIDRSGELQLHPELQPLTLSPDKAVPLVFILNELVTNALKYAFPPPAKGAVMVRLFPSDKGCTLTEADNGVGVASDPKHAKKPRSGLGTWLVESFVKTRDADLVAATAHGLRHDITFQPYSRLAPPPLPDGRAQSLDRVGHFIAGVRTPELARRRASLAMSSDVDTASYHPAPAH